MDLSDLTAERQHDLELAGVAATAREEKLAARRLGVVQIERKTERKAEPAREETPVGG